MYLSSLAPELLLNIISYLDPYDLANFIQTCRYIYNTCNGLLRQKVDALTLEFFTEFRHPVGGWGRYYSLRNSGLMFAVSFTIVDVESGHQSSIYNTLSEDLFEALKSQITKGNKRIINGKIQMSEEMLNSSRHIRRILLTLNAYSHFHPASEFSVTSLCAKFPLKDVPILFDTRKLTKLCLTFRTALWEYDYSKGFPNPNSEPSQHAPPKKEVLQDILSLKDLLLKVSNLEVLSLRPQVSFIGIAEPLLVSPPALSQLKQAVEGLTKLHTLKISQYLFHPSFFLPVPETVKTLQYKKTDRLSQQWWCHFARAPLTNVENLSIGLESSGFLSGSSTNAGAGYKGFLKGIGKGFTIGDVEIRSLKKFTCQDADNLRLPRDLVECIKRKNQGLEE
ncbi:hypothetical protein TWF506_010490 [Arthrobotrys conoides]|uniref:F-box domain-containing protein n=1 Tax=Arthrobotrys conoides TaxID=74498 RepID=A0AAN8RKZ2_9PEZI